MRPQGPGGWLSSWACSSPQTPWGGSYVGLPLAVPGLLALDAIVACGAAASPLLLPVSFLSFLPQASVWNMVSFFLSPSL